VVLILTEIILSLAQMSFFAAAISLGGRPMFTAGLSQLSKTCSIYSPPPAIRIPAAWWARESRLTLRIMTRVALPRATALKREAALRMGEKCGTPCARMAAAPDQARARESADPSNASSPVIASKARVYARVKFVCAPVR